jgi:hypothetical protein
VQGNASEILARGLIGQSDHILNLRKVIARVAPTNLPVLLSGESGVGKDSIARLLHQVSPRAGKPFIRIDLAALPESLVHSDLFGVVKGAFTGATRNRVGRLRSADGGTIYFGALDDLKGGSEIQRLLLGFLNSQSFIPLGGTKPVQVNVRFVAGTRIRPNELTSVLPDLLLRLSSVVIEIPALRDRPEDIPLLIEDFFKRAPLLAERSPTFSAEAIEGLKRYSFPGNVSELYNIIERAVLLSEGGPITLHDLRLQEPKQEPESDTIEKLRGELSEKRRELELLRRGTIAADPIWQGRWIPSERDYCFVLMPFAEAHDLQEVYARHVRPVVEERCRLRCERADDIHDVSGIMQSVWESINRARFVIADLTDRNPNVFYELGIAHTLGKAVIIITQSMEYVPFDLRHLRCIVYSFKPGRIEKFEETLEKTIRTVMSSSPMEPSFDLVQE